MADELRVYLRHVQATGFCLAPGAKKWFVSNGLDWRSFTRNGIPASELLALNDALANRVVDTARREQESRNGQGQQ